MRRKNTKEDFWKHVDKSTGPDGCWAWTGYKDRDGYGRFSINSKQVPTHRISWELHNKKKIPKGKLVCHSCDNPSCVNPGHLWMGTYADNLLDASIKGRLDESPILNGVEPHNKIDIDFDEEEILPKSKLRPMANKDKTHCKNGHPLSGTNLIVTHNGRNCRICQRKLKRKYDRRMRALDREKRAAQLKEKLENVV